MRNQNVVSNLDWLTILLYILLVTAGWLNIYSASLPAGEPEEVFDFTQAYGRQLLFMGLSFPLILALLFTNAKIFEKFSFVFYGCGIILLLGLFVFGKTIKGQTNWYQFGGFGLQPSEFVKTATALLLAKYLSYSQTNLNKEKTKL